MPAEMPLLSPTYRPPANCCFGSYVPLFEVDVRPSQTAFLPDKPTLTFFLCFSSSMNRYDRSHPRCWLGVGSVTVVRFDVSRVTFRGLRDDQPGRRVREDDDAEHTGQ